MSHVTDNIALSAESILTKMLDNDLIRDETSKAYTIEELSNMAVRAARVIHGLPAEKPESAPLRAGYIAVSVLDNLPREKGSRVTMTNHVEWIRAEHIEALVRGGVAEHNEDGRSDTYSP